MKRQSTISSFFAKKPTQKKPKTDNDVTSIGTTNSSNTIHAIDTSEFMDVDEPSTPKKQHAAPTRDEIAELSSRFEKKFGSLNELNKSKRQHVEKLMTDINNKEENVTPHQKFTPLESQVVDLKSKYPGCLLLIEVGYKFRFFGEDAKIASKILHIANFIDRNFYVASIPTHRLNYHVKKLVSAGHRVGIVRQTETAALKAAGSNRNQPFVRDLTQMVTKGTMVDEMIENDNNTSATSGYLMCLVEEKRGGNGPDERVLAGMVAIQPATGDIIYDSFEDTYMRTELETRLLHIEPSEILIPQWVSQPTEKLVKHLTLRKSAIFGQEESVRIERMPEDDTFCSDYNSALTYVTEFYSTTTVLPTIMDLPDIIIKSLAALIRYLEEFKLSNILKVTKYFSHFVTKSHMLLNGNTLVNLEIYRNNTNFKEEGSLFSVLNHTSTKFGTRLLRKWIGRPLVDVNKLNERIEAVDELIKTENPKKNQALKLFKQLPDIEKGLCRIHYGKAMPVELIQVLDALIKISSAFYNAYEPRFHSKLLDQLFDILPTIRDQVVHFKQSIREDFQSQDKIIDFFKDEQKWPEIPREKKNIKFVDSLLQEHLQELKESTGLQKDLEFVSVAGIDYLLQVSNSKLKKVPASWVKISGTKAVSRFHSKYIIEQIKERERHTELLELFAQTAYKGFLSHISEHYESFRDIVSSLAHLDCLISLSITASQSNYVKPTFLTAPDGLKMEIINGRHPIVEITSTKPYVTNNVYFDETQRAMVLTGPNMGGKSSYIRQIALIAIMAQVGSHVPATQATLSVLDAVYTRMGASDNMMRGESTFMVELHETSDIMKQATRRSLVILDELGRGTSTHDGQAIAYAVLKHVVQNIQPITLFVTHYPSLGKLAKTLSQVRNCYMSYIEEKDELTDFTNIVFLYKLVDGIALYSYGMNVARLANVPFSVIKTAKIKSDQVRKDMEERQIKNRKVSLLKKVLTYTTSDPESLDMIKNEINSLSQ